jgi:hypothetical protein
MAKRNAGGGHGSSVVKNNRDGRKVEPRPRAVSEAAVSQIGSQMGNHVTEMGAKMKAWGGSEPLYSGRGYSAPTGANVNTKPAVMKSGSQSQHGPVAGTRPQPGAPSPQGCFEPGVGR